MSRKQLFTIIILLVSVISGTACLRQSRKTDPGKSHTGNSSSTVNTGQSNHSSSPVVSSENKSGNTTNAGGNSEGKLPKNWPWRGICIESKNTHADDIDYLAGLHVNFLRLQLKPSRRTLRDKGDPTVNFYKELAWADSMLDKCKQHGITTVLAFNFLVLDPKLGIEDKSAEFWEKKSFIDSTYRMVDIIARRFQQRGDELSCYEIIGEPAIQGPGGAKVPKQIETFYQEVLKTIRKYDQNRWLLLTPGPWGRPTNYENFKPFQIKDDKIIYGAHMYLPDAFTHQGVKERKRGFKYPDTYNGNYFDKDMIRKKFSYLAEFEKKYNYPIYIGEFQAARWSEGADLWVKDVLETIDSYGWAWSYFAYEAGQNFWDPFYDVSNSKDKPENWQIEFKGPSTSQWKYMISEFEKNKNRK